MKKVRGIALVLGTAAAALAFSAGPASAHGDWDDHGHGHGHGHGDWYDNDGHSQSSNGNVGALNGNQIAIPVNVPINACGNSLALLGLANSNAGCVNN
jgi:hypothetical protein